MARKKKEKSSEPKLGAQYQAAKLALQVGSGPVYAGAVQKTGSAVVDRLKSSAYHKGVALGLLDQWGSKKLGHAGAISRRSVTAIAPEVIAGAEAATAANFDPLHAANRFNLNTDGYDFINDQFVFDQAKGYFVQKYGLGIVRKVANKTRIAEPIKRFLGMMGVSL